MTFGEQLNVIKPGLLAKYQQGHFLVVLTHDAQEPRKHDRNVARVLTRRGLAAALVLALPFSALQIFNDFYREKEDNTKFIGQVLQVGSASATEAAFQRDSAMGHVALNAIAMHDFVKSAKLVDDFDEVLAHIDKESEPSPNSWITSALTEPFPAYSTHLIDPRLQKRVGTLELVVDQDQLLGDFYARSLRVVVFGVLRNIILTLFLLAIFSRLLTRPMVALLQAFHQVDATRPESIAIPAVVQLQRNEITKLGETLNEILAASEKNLKELHVAECERGRMADELAHAEKLRAIGQLTGGIAHDFNNLLHVIIGNVELAQHSPENVSDCLVETLQAADKAAELTHHLLAYSRKQELAPVAIDVGGFLKGVSAILNRLLGEGIRVETKVASDVRQCFVDPGQLETALINLATNARDAMPRGGMLRIEATAKCRTPSEPPPNATAPYVCIAVSDRGLGMTPETVRRATEPFFTTKSVGKGSGLGLSMVVGFAEQSGGSFNVLSEYGAGTTVSLILPGCTSGPAAAKRKLKPTPGSHSLTGLNILLLDDQEMVTNTLSKHLKSMGGSVLAASSVSAAIKQCTLAQQVDVFLLDVVLPGETNGVVASQSLLAIHPDAKVILMSGYTRDRLDLEISESCADRILQKPITRASLYAAILDATQPQ